MSTTTPASKPAYYTVLDGLRGLAALVILVFHYLEMIYFDDYVTNPMGHGYLAVDFFFCLSGFVVAFAYDGRIGKLGVKNFFINRLIRLHPMVVLGMVLGVVAYLFDPFQADPRSAGLGGILGAFALSLLLIPTPWLPYRGGGLFPFNTPSWSLFYEYLANVAYAYVLCRLKKVPLLIVGLLAAVWLGYCAHRTGWLIDGWSAGGWDVGLSRVCFSFTAGMIVYRWNWIFRNRFGFFLPALLLMGVFLFPHHTGDWVNESIMVMVIFPLLIALGAGATVRGATERLCLFLGKLSYPLYLTHIPVVWLYTSWMFRDTPPLGTLFGVAAGGIVLNLAVAYAAMRWYDAPVRRWLTGLHKKR